MPSTTTPRRINADVFRRARKAGAPLDVAAYVARPPVLDLTFEYDSTVREHGADVAPFELDGRHFLAIAEDIGGECESCAELVRAWRDRDENIAWMTDDDFERTEHRALSVEVIDADGEETGYAASLYGVCSMRSTEVDRLSDDRYVAETVADLASEAARYAETAERRATERTEEARNVRDAERRAVLDHLIGIAIEYRPASVADADDMRDAMRGALGWRDDQPAREWHPAVSHEGGNDFPPQTFPV